MPLREGLLKKRRPGVMPRICRREHGDMEERGTSRITKTKAPRTKEKSPLDPESESWRKLPWRKFEQHVYRIQKRIFQAEQRGNQRAVQKLQKLLMKSRAAQLLAVRRVTQDNQGKKTAGVDGVKAVKPAQRLVMAEHIHPKHWKQMKAKPVRRVYIPKPGKLEKRPLGIPIWAVHYPSFQAMFGIPWVLLLVDRAFRPTFIVLLYHKLTSITSASLLPLPANRLAQGGDDLGGEGNPAWSQRRGTHALQNASLAPGCDGRDVDIKQVCGGTSRVASISPLPGWCRFWTLRTSSRNVIGVANPLDFTDGKRASHASALSFLIEQGSNTRSGMRRTPLPHALYHLHAGLAFFPRHFVAWDGKPREGLGLPANSDIDDIASLRERHIFDQPPHELLALDKGRRRSVPDGRQIMGQAADLLALRGREQQHCCFGQQRVLPFQFFHLRQLLIPLPLQAPGHEAVIRVDCDVSTAGQVCFILRPLNLPLPLVIDLLGTGLHLVQSREGYFQVGRFNGLQKAGNHSLIDAISSHGLAGSCGKLRMELVTFVHQHRAIALIANAHASATGATQDDPLQERWSFSNRSSVLFCPPGAIVIQLPLVAQKLIPGDVAWMGIQQDDGPVFLFDPTRSPFDPWLFSGQGPTSELSPPIDVGSRIQGAVQDVQHTLMREATPDQLIGSLASPPPCWEAQMLLGKGADDGEGRGRLLKQREDQTNGFGNGLIWVKHNPAHRIVDQANGQAKTQTPLFGFALFSSLQAALQPMKLGLRHAALETEQQTVVMRSGIIHPFVINHQGIGQRTDFQQPIPITARPRQARNLQAEHGPNVPQTHFSHQPLKPIATNDRGARLSLVLVHHLDTGRRPSQVGSALDQIILPGRTASVFSDLEKRGLPHIYDSEPIKMIRTDFLRRESVQHQLPPFRHTHFHDEPPYSTLIEQADQSHEYADRGRGQATPGPVRLSPQKRVDARTCANLLARHVPQERQILLSYLTTSWKRIEPLLLRNPLGDLPQPFNCEQGWFCRVGISWRCPGVIGQARGNGSMIAIGHADDEVRIWPTSNSNELQALAIQGMMGMGHRHPFLRWLGKGGSVL